MLWLDSTYPPEKEGQPGAARGDCPQDSGVPADVEAQYPDAYVPHIPSTESNVLGINRFAARLSGPTSASDLLAPPSPHKKSTTLNEHGMHGESRSYTHRLPTRCSNGIGRSPFTSQSKHCIYQDNLHTALFSNLFLLKPRISRNLFGPVGFHVGRSHPL